MSSDPGDVFAREVPTYRELYHEWETAHWEAGALPLQDDRARWESLPDEARDPIRAALLSLYADAESLTTRLVVIVDAVPDEDAQVVAATHLVDAARHVVFYDRALTEVCGESDRPAGWLLDDKPRLYESVVDVYVEVEAGRCRQELDALRFAVEVHGLGSLGAGLDRVAGDFDRHLAWAVRYIRENRPGDAPLPVLVRTSFSFGAESE